MIDGGDDPNLDKDLTKRHNDYYGEKLDSGLEKLILANKRKNAESCDPSNINNSVANPPESVRTDVEAVVIPNTTMCTRRNPPEIPVENVQILHSRNKRKGSYDCLFFFYLNCMNSNLCLSLIIFYCLPSF